MTARPVGFFLDATAPLQQLGAEAWRLTALHRDFAELAGRLAAASRVSRCIDGTLVVAARHGSAAAKLNQSAPQLLRALQSRGHPLVDLRVEVRPVSPPRPIVKTAVLGDAGINAFRELAVSLPESPLRYALDMLVARHTTSTSRSRAKSARITTRKTKANLNTCQAKRK